MGLFEESYSLLNAAQKQAVDHIDGPLLVVAGPGTGKTQLLSMRVANILRQTDTDASSILCLTFTNKAALNMRQRLIDLTDGEGREVMIKTFHSFAAELMNMYPDYFWNGARLSTAPDTVQIEIIQNILGRLPLSSPLSLKFAGNYTAGYDVKNALKYAKEAGLTPDKLRALAQANLAYLDVIEPQLVDILSTSLSYKSLADLKQKVLTLPNQGISAELQPLQDLGQVIKDSLDFAISQDEGTGKTKHTGKWKLRWVQSVDGQKSMLKERERNTWWLNLSDVYEMYRNELHRRGYYDYSDMIVEVITQLQQHADMRADAQERFLYVLIDEFQDTNAAQLQLAHLIADHHAADGRPNLMAVGDDDQSIYKFNGAELNNMLSFQTSYPSAELVVLQDNYRSSQAVLDTSTKVIAQINDRLVTRMPGLKKDLVAKNEPKSSSQIIHKSYETEEDQFSSLARRIAERREASDGSIAVIARDHASLKRMASILTALDVPVSYEMQGNILEHPAVRLVHQINSLLVAIHDGDIETSNVLLADILPAPMWQIEPANLWQLAVANRRNGNWLDSLLKSKNEALNNIGQWLVWLAKLATTEPLAVTLEYVLGLQAGEHLTSPFNEYFLRQEKVDTNYLGALSAIRLLRGLTEEYAKTNDASLADFVNFIQLAIDSEEVIADETSFVSGDHAVELLTVHKSKGLEFDSVYIINAIDQSWRPSAGRRKTPANLPLQPAGDDIDDYARLMYVAMTRAKQNITIGSYRQEITGKDVLATPLLHEALPPEVTKSIVNPVQVLQENLVWPRLNSQDERLNLKPQLDNFSLSATALLDFLDVSKGGPDYFLSRHLLRLPETKTTNMAFGTAIHEGLEYAQHMVNDSGLVIQKVLDQYQKALADQQLPDHDYQRFLDHGQELLNKLLKSQTFWLGKKDLPEQALNDVTVGQARLNGKIDRIHQAEDNRLVIIDYKTGKPLGSFTTRDQTKAIKAWRHRTQLIFYALLVKNSGRFKPQTTEGQMWYVEAALAKELIREYSPTAEELDRMTQLINAIWPKIKQLNLPNIANYSADYAGIQNFEQDLIDGKI